MSCSVALTLFMMRFFRESNQTSKKGSKGLSASCFFDRCCLYTFEQYIGSTMWVSPIVIERICIISKPYITRSYDELH